MNTAVALTTNSATTRDSTGRYSYKKEYKDEEAAFYGASDPAGPGQRNPNNRWNVAVGMSRVFTPSFTMSVNLGGMKWVEGNDVQSNGFKASSLGLPSFIDTNSQQFPIISLASYAPEGPVAGAGQGAFPRSAASGSVDFVKVRGSHQLSLRLYRYRHRRKRRALSFHPIYLQQSVHFRAGSYRAYVRNRRLERFDADGVACQWKHRHRHFRSDPYVVPRRIFAG